MKQKLKEKFTALYLIPQESKWKRIIDSFAVILCFLSALIALYLLKTQPEGKLSTVSNLVIWGYIFTSIPLFFLLYKKSQLKKIERFALVLFILLSSMSMLFSVTSVYIKHNN